MTQLYTQIYHVPQHEAVPDAPGAVSRNPGSVDINNVYFEATLHHHHNRDILSADPRRSSILRSSADFLITQYLH